MIEYVISYSGGLSSHLAAHRIIEEAGPDRCVLLFADTRCEDEDLYRFVAEGSDALGCRLVRVADGRDIWQVFKDERFLGNSRIDPCSRILKRELLDQWKSENAHDAAWVIGYTVCEPSRFDKFKARHPNARAPLMEPPTIKSQDVAGEFSSMFPTLRAPRLYAMGAKHNNCGGGCVKAGQKHFDWLRRTLPEVYAKWERGEQELREYLGKDVTILTDRRGGEKKPLSLKQFRERMECGGEAVGESAACRCMDVDE